MITILRAMDIRPLLRHVGSRWAADDPIFFDEDSIKNGINYIKDTFGVDIDRRKFKVFAYSCMPKNRSDLNFIEFHCVPGYFCVSYSTDRVSVDGDWMPNSELERVICDLSN